MTSQTLGRRIIPATAISIVVAVVLGGVASAADGDVTGNAGPALPDEFGVAEPRQGDTWRYNITLEGDWTFGLEDILHKEHSLAFAHLGWVDHGQVRGGDGFMHDANLLGVRLMAYNPYIYEEVDAEMNSSSGVRAENPFWHEMESYAWFGAETGKIVQTGEAWGENDTYTEYGIALGIGASVRNSNWVEQFVEYPEDASHCLAENALQGTNVTLDAPAALVPGCTLGSEFLAVPDGLRLRAAGVETIDGLETVRFVGKDNGTFEFWFTPGIPYPVRVRMELPAVPVDPDDYWSEWYAYPGERVATLDLKGYRAGDAPLDSVDDAGDAGAAPALSYKARQPWGLDDSGIEHPFPISQAYQAALDDQVFTDLRTYTTAHPRAVMVAAEFTHVLEEQEERRTWRMVMADGSEEDFGFSVSQVNRDPLLPTALHGQLPPQLRFERGDYPWYVNYDLRLRPSDLPDEVPTVASLAERWAAFDGSGTQFNMWGFGYGCWWFDGACDKPELIVMAGHIRDANGQHWGPGSIPGYPLGSEDYAYIERHVYFDGEGNALMMRNTEERSTTTPIDSGPVPSPPTVGASPDLGPSAATIEVVPQGSWMPPPKQAAGIGFFALAMGFLYWIWPKLTVVGLFSRVHGQAVLEHPARQNLLQIVEAQPGIHLKEIGRRSKLANGALQHHLDKLKESGMVVARPMGGYTCYFPRGARIDPSAPVLKSLGARQVFEAVRRQPGLSSLELANLTGLQPSTVNYHVQRLTSAGLVGALRDGRSLRLHARTDVVQAGLEPAP
jgi:DNA-binding transcriptional ArsR family regulator